ncbi:MAG: flagellin [Pseudomonadota bacterium]
MGLVLRTNVSSLVAQRNLWNNTNAVRSSFEKLSSGLRINRAADDAAGLSISETLKTQIRGNQKAVSNAQDGVNILQIAEGSLGVISENLQRIRELTVQAANDTNSTTERTAIKLEVQSRLDDINRIARSTRSSNIYLLDGSRSTYFLQVGANSTATQNTIDIANVLATATVAALSLTNTVTAGAGGVFENNTSCRNFLDDLDTALQRVNDRRAQLGALQNRLESTIESLNISIENLKSTNSRIRDLDIASESAVMTQNQILQQSALSVLAQANQTPTLALQLLQ